MRVRTCLRVCVRVHVRVTPELCHLLQRPRGVGDLLPPRVRDLDHLPVLGRRQLRSLQRMLLLLYYRPLVPPNRRQNPCQVCGLAVGAERWLGLGASSAEEG